MKILFHAIDGASIGHINRLVCIALNIRRKQPDAHILFVTNSDFVDFFYRNRLKFVKIPKDTGTILSKSEDFEFAVPKHANLKVLEGICEGFCPDIIFFDTHFPEEFVQSCRKRGVRTYLVLGVYNESIVQQASGFFEKIFVASEPPENSPINGIIYAGSIVREEEYDPSVKRRYELSPKQLNILITAGSGGYEPETQAILRESINACRGLARPVNIIAVSGPLFKGYRDFIKIKGVRFTRYEPKMISLMKSVDVVISHAGQNTSNELISYKVPSMLLPVYREGDDQKARAKRLADEGLCIAIENWNASAIRAGVNSILRKNKNIKSALEARKQQNGAEKISSEIEIAPSVKIISLAGKTLTSTVSELKNAGNLSRVFLEKGNFGWHDLQLLLEWLKVMGTNEIFIRIEQPVPPSLVDGLSKYPVVYVFELNSLDQIEHLSTTYKELKKGHLPVLTRVTANEESTAEIIVAELINHRAYTIQIFAGGKESEGKKYANLTNLRMLPGNSLFDISLRDSGNLHLPSKSLLAEKELAEVVNEHKSIQKNLADLLESKGINLEVEFLLSEIQRNSNSGIGIEAEKLEAEKYDLFKSRKMLDKVGELDKELGKAEFELSKHFNKFVRILLMEQNRLHYEQHQVLESKGLAAERINCIGLIHKLEDKKGAYWQKQTAIWQEIEKTKKTRENELNKNDIYCLILQLRRKLDEARRKRDTLWNNYTEIEKLLRKKQEEIENEKLKLAEFKKHLDLKKQLSAIDSKFNSFVASRFEPVRINISFLESKTSLNENEKKELERLKIEKDEVWGKELSPIERQRDNLLFELKKVESAEKFSEKQKKFVAATTKLEDKLAGTGIDLEQVKGEIKSKEGELSKAENRGEYKKILSGFDKKISKLISAAEKISSSISYADAEIKMLKDKWQQNLADAGIAQLNNDFKDKIARLSEKIENAKDKQRESYVEFLRQKKDALLVSGKVHNELNRIDMLLASEYQKYDGLGARLLKNKLNSLLLHHGIFQEFFKLQQDLRNLENAMEHIKAY